MTDWSVPSVFVPATVHPYMCVKVCVMLGVQCRISAAFGYVTPETFGLCCIGWGFPGTEWPSKKASHDHCYHSTMCDMPCIRLGIYMKTVLPYVCLRIFSFWVIKCAYLMTSPLFLDMRLCMHLNIHAHFVCMCLNKYPWFMLASGPC